MKRIALLIAMTTLPVMALAADTLTFKGEVTTQTCSVSINGGSATVVLLPTVSTKSLEKTGGTTGDTAFTLEISGCEAPKEDIKVVMKLLGTSVTDSGNLRNVGSAGGVAVQLVDPDGEPVKLSGITTVNGLVLRRGETSANRDFTVRYVREGGEMHAGTVTASVQYSISYL